MVHAVHPPATRARQRSVLAILLTGQVMASIDGSIVSVAAPTIRAGLGATDAEIQLVVSGYLLTTGVLFVTCARIGDLVGHRRAFLGGLGWFTGASLLCGLSDSAMVLILARIAQAVGAALLMPQVFSLIHRQWEGAQRHRAIGWYSMVLALGVALGQVAGGFVVGTDLFGLSWRPVFLINVPIGVAALAIGTSRLPRSRPDERARLDPVGVALLTVTMVAITLPLIFAGSRGWSTPMWLLLAGGSLLLVAFVRYENRARHPVLDLAVLKPKQVRLGLIACCLVMGGYTVFLLTLTLHLQTQLAFSPLRAGLTFVPYAVGFGTLSLCWSSYPERLQRALPIVGPLACGTALLLVVALLRAGLPAGYSVPLLFLAGVGHAAGYSPLIALITTQVGPRLASAVSALNATGPVLAEVIAVAGVGSIYFAAPTSADGLLRVTVVVAALLCTAAACAAPAVRIHLTRTKID